MTSKRPQGSTRSNKALALLIAASLMMPACAQEPLAASALLPPLPGPAPLPLPLPPALSLAPPELPTIPSLPQVLPPNAPTTSGSTELPVTSAEVDARILILSADGNEPVLSAIRQAADYIGIPYLLYVASRTPGGFTPEMLSDGDARAYYQGIVMTTGSLGYFDGTTWTSAFNMTEWQTLWDYQAKFRVRTAIGYVFPTEDYGYGAATGLDTTSTPISDF